MTTQPATFGLPTNIISVRHECEDGWHIFTSPEVPGLLVGGPDEDIDALYESIPATISALVQADFGLNIELKLAQSFSSYAARLPASHQPGQRLYAVLPLAA